MKTLLIEGWRRINHSYALVNQHQIVRLARMKDLRVLHRDLPFAFPNWQADDGDGFAPEERALIDGLPPPSPDDRVDAVYRICSPFRWRRSGWERARLVTFLAVETGILPGVFATARDQTRILADDEPIVLPSSWSRDRIVEAGARVERTHVVPHGVDRKRFRPVASGRRQVLRARAGVADDETLFVNVAAPFWHKGTDLLLTAFATLRLRGMRVRLFVKDQRALYGRTLDDFVRDLARTDPRLLDERVLSGLTVFPGTLSPDEVASLIGIADCYVSPYRAEGFNLPVLEAIACRVPLIVSAGGATDEFCDDALAIRLSGRLVRTREANTDLAYVEPDLDMLVDGMAAVAGGARPEPARFEAARLRTLARCDWGRAAEAVAGVAFGQRD